MNVSAQTTSYSSRGGWMGPRYNPHVDGMHVPTNKLMQVCIYMNMMTIKPFRPCGKSLMHIQLNSNVHKQNKNTLYIQ